MIEDCLNEIIENLKKNPLFLKDNSLDGRLSSALNEEQIIIFLKSYFPSLVRDTPIRFFCDVFIDNEPVNIKISSMNTSDNINSKIGLGYALTNGKILSNISSIFIKDLKLNLDKLSKKDYYFLIIDKNNTSKSFWTSLKRINILTPNGSNLPFQCNWGREREMGFTSRSIEEQSNYLLESFYKSCLISPAAIFEKGLKDIIVT